MDVRKACTGIAIGDKTAAKSAQTTFRVAWHRTAGHAQQDSPRHVARHLARQIEPATRRASSRMKVK